MDPAEDRLEGGGGGVVGRPPGGGGGPGGGPHPGEGLGPGGDPRRDEGPDALGQPGEAPLEGEAHEAVPRDRDRVEGEEGGGPPRPRHELPVEGGNPPLPGLVLPARARPARARPARARARARGAAARARARPARARARARARPAGGGAELQELGAQDRPAPPGGDGHGPAPVGLGGDEEAGGGEKGAVVGPREGGRLGEEALEAPVGGGGGPHEVGHAADGLEEEGLPPAAGGGDPQDGLGGGEDVGGADGAPRRGPLGELHLGLVLEEGGGAGGGGEEGGDGPGGPGGPARPARPGGPARPPEHRVHDPLEGPGVLPGELADHGEVEPPPEGGPPLGGHEEVHGGPGLHADHAPLVGDGGGAGGGLGGEGHGEGGPPAPRAGGGPPGVGQGGLGEEAVPAPLPPDEGDLAEAGGGGPAAPLPPAAAVSAGDHGDGLAVDGGLPRRPLAPRHEVVVEGGQELAVDPLEADLELGVHRGADGPLRRGRVAAVLPHELGEARVLGGARLGEHRLFPPPPSSN